MIKQTLSAQAALLNELITAAIEPHLKAENMTLSLFELMSAIRATGNRATQIEIARRMGITAPSLSETVKSAVQKGFIEQAPVEKDGRAKVLKLTELGEKRLQKAVKHLSAIDKQMVAGIPAEDLTKAIETLRLANRNLAKELSE